MLENKGGQRGNQDQNIDLQAVKKFEALTQYADSYKVNWGVLDLKITDYI